MTKSIITGVLVDKESYSFLQVCQKYELTEENLMSMLEYGLIPSDSQNIRDQEFDANALQKIQSACRLQHDLEINIPGVVLALELIEELEGLKKELQILRRHIR